MTERLTPKRKAALLAAQAEADALRKDWKDAMQQHGLRVEAQFGELRRRLRVKPAGRQSKGLPAAKDAEHIRALMAHVRVKAGRGRAKDLRRVEDALRQAIDKLPSE